MKARVPGLLSLFLEHIVRNRKRDCYQKNPISKNSFCASSRIVVTKNLSSKLCLYSSKLSRIEELLPKNI